MLKTLGRIAAALSVVCFVFASAHAQNASVSAPPSTDYLKVISEACKMELKRQFEGESFPDSERIAGSVEDVVGDEKKWLISRDGFVVVFDSMQFGPSGSGEHTVVVPFTALKNFIRPDGPLASLSK